MEYSFRVAMEEDGTASFFIDDEVFVDLCGNPNVRSNVVTVTQGRCSTAE